MVTRKLFLGIAITLLLYLVLLLFPIFTAAETFLSGAGATFPYPLYQKWIEVYQNQTSVRISYAAVGSGKGIKQLLERVVDFGATDIFLSNEETQRTADEILHIPTCVGAVTVIYHLPGNPELRLTSELIADIFSGEIVNWSDQRISRVNPGIKMPKLDITVVHRSEESGTNFIFTDYLTKTNSKWRDNKVSQISGQMVSRR